MTEPDASDTTPVPLLGSVTGYAKEVVRNIRRAAVSAQMKDFLLEVYDRSFSNAGYQRRAGLENPGGSCPFDNASWASELGMRRQHMYRLRKRAEELGILFYDEGERDLSCGWLRWNLAFDQWQPLDTEYRRQRYARPGAGRKSNGLRSIAENESNGVRSIASDRIKLVTPACFNPATEAAREAPLRKEKEEAEKKKIETTVSSAAEARAMET